MAFDIDEEGFILVFPTILNKQFLKCESCRNELQLDPKLDFVTNLRQEGWRSKWSGRSEEDDIKQVVKWSGIFIICPDCARGNTNIDWGEKYCHNCHKPTKDYYCDECLNSVPPRSESEISQQLDAVASTFPGRGNYQPPEEE